MQIEKARHERHPSGVDAAGAGGRFDARADGLDAVATDDYGLLRRLGAGPVNHGRANDGGYIFVVLFAGVGDTWPGVVAITRRRRGRHRKRPVANVPGTAPVFAGVGGEKAYTDEHHDRQQSAVHQVSKIMICQKRIRSRSPLRTTFTDFTPLRTTRLPQPGFSQGRETRAAPDYTKKLPSSRGLKSGKSGVGNGEWGMGNGEWGMGTRGLLSNPHSPLPTPHSHLKYIASGDTEEAER